MRIAWDRVIVYVVVVVGFWGIFLVRELWGHRRTRRHRPWTEER